MDSVLDPSWLFAFDANQAPFMSGQLVAILSVSYVVMAKSSFLSRWLAPMFKQSSITSMLTLHNTLMSVMSLVMLLGLLGSVAYLMQHGNTFYDLYCDPLPDGKNNVGLLYFWMYLFYLSKVYEWVDTVFLLLRGKNPPFLHVYHHFLTYILMWVGLRTYTTFSWIGMLLNVFVHTAMYSYYAMATGRKEKPWWGQYLTRMQMTQFVINFCGLWLWTYWHLRETVGCSGGYAGLLLCGLAMVTYFALFYSMYRDKYSKEE
mmetsp:Transcript_27869/g.69875  ORF Transcript_27869/g.69875 Transcript_27869/m.69875 type:complete len:260 (-) Transcript_27869:171-950(-)